jgi:hypothetical protein
MNPKCKTNVPDRLTDSACVKKGAGGHKNAMINYVNSDETVSCGKKFSQKEYDFYNTINTLKNQKNIAIFLKYIPKFYSLICEHNKNKYFIFENLAGNYKNPSIMDIKLGHTTTYSPSYIKRMRHLAIDNIFSISGKYSIRLEGANFPLNNYTSDWIPTLPGKKYQRYKYNPFDIFISFIESLGTLTQKQISKIFSSIEYQLNELIHKALIPNLEILEHIKQGKQVKKMAFGLVGTSLLIIGESSKAPKLKLIDFFNNRMISNFSNNKEVELAIKENNNMLDGLETIRSLVDDLSVL